MLPGRLCAGAQPAILGAHKPVIAATQLVTDGAALLLGDGTARRCGALTHSPDCIDGFDARSFQAVMCRVRLNAAQQRRSLLTCCLVLPKLIKDGSHSWRKPSMSPESLPGSLCVQARSAVQRRAHDTGQLVGQGHQRPGCLGQA